MLVHALAVLDLPDHGERHAGQGQPAQATLSERPPHREPAAGAHAGVADGDRRAPGRLRLRPGEELLRDGRHVDRPGSSRRPAHRHRRVRPCDRARRRPRHRERRPRRRGQSAGREQMAVTSPPPFVPDARGGSESASRATAARTSTWSPVGAPSAASVSRVVKEAASPPAPISEPAADRDAALGATITAARPLVQQVARGQRAARPRSGRHRPGVDRPSTAERAFTRRPAPSR